VSLAGTHLSTRLYGITFQMTVMLLRSHNNGQDAVRTGTSWLDVTWSVVWLYSHVNVTHMPMKLTVKS